MGWKEKRTEVRSESEALGKIMTMSVEFPVKCIDIESDKKGNVFLTYEIWVDAF